MSAATQNRDGQRQPGEVVAYNGSSGYNYYKETLVQKTIGSAVVNPAVQGAGASNARFIGVVVDRVDLTAGLGSSNAVLNVYKRGEFTFVANGTGVSVHIGQRAFALDDQTVGVSMGVPCLWVGEITGIPTSGTYRVLIDNAVGQPMSSHTMGASWTVAQN